MRISSVIVLLLSVSAFAQTPVVVYDHNALFFNTDACSTGGPNSTFTVSGADGARHVTGVVSFLISAGNNTRVLANRAMLEVMPDNNNKVDDDSLYVLMMSYAYSDTSAAYIDTLFMPLVAGKVSQKEITPYLADVGANWFPYQAQFSFANEDSGTNTQFPYFGLSGDTSIWFARLIIWNTEAQGMSTITISDYMLDADTTSLSNRINGKPDSAVVGFLAQAETIAGNWVNTANPWADNEVSDVLTVTGYQEDADSSTFNATKTDLRPPYFRALPAFYSDFLYSGANTNPPWTGAALTSGTLAATAAAQSWGAHPGVAKFLSATGANSGYTFLNSASQLIAGGENFEAICYFPNLDSVIAFLGWHDGSGSGEATDGVYVKVTGDSVAVGKSYSNSSATLTASTYTLNDSVWYRSLITLNSGGTRAYYSIYSEAGVRLWYDSTSATIPTGAGRESSNKVSCVWTGTNTAKDILLLDWMAIWTTTALVR